MPSIQPSTPANAPTATAHLNFSQRHTSDAPVVRGENNKRRNPALPEGPLEHLPKRARPANTPSTALDTFRNAATRVVAKPVTAQEVEAARRRADAVAYKRVFDTIQQRYKSFSQTSEIGFDGKDGLTGDIADIKTSDLISILRHIASDEDRRAGAAKKSGISPLFDKIYLMENRAQGWNLRLHEFAPGGGAQAEEESPHFHRWTLASKILMGGYNNKNYEEITASEAKPDELLHKYHLGPTLPGATERAMVHQGRVGMRLNMQTLFRHGDVRHFPIAVPHSVADLSEHTGTTLTLAHTGKPVHETSSTYRTTGDMSSDPLEKPALPEQFIESLHDKIALLQLSSLRDALLAHLGAKAPKELTEKEQRHLQDCKAPNYLETSLLPALAILGLAGRNRMPSEEFSPATEAFLKAKLARINETSLQELIKANQHHIESGHFSAEVTSWEQMQKKLGPG